MEKAYDVKVLGEKLKAKGLVQAEDAAVMVVEEVFAWLEESADLSQTPYDDFAKPVFKAVKPLVLKEVDKIDGVVG